MAGHFDFLAKAKPASLHKLLEKLPTNEAAIVLTGLPHSLAIQALAFFPEHLQGAFLPLMRAARSAPERDREDVSGKIHAMLGAAKAAREGKTGSIPTPETTPPPPAPAAKTEKPGIAQTLNRMQNTSLQPAPQSAPAPAPAPLETPPPRTIMPGTANPYESAPPPRSPVTGEKTPRRPSASASALTGLGSMLKEVLHKAAASPTPPAAKQPDGPKAGGRAKNSGKPTPWVPRTATSSPINGPALPGKPPPVAGDPFASPLARAGLLDLIGRAQDKLLPKGTVAKAAGQGRAPVRRPLIGKDGRPEPREGVARAGEVTFSKTPREIGPKPKAVESGGGARRMDGKAILAAILREAGPDVRESVREDDPGLMRELRGRMFYFDDLIYTDDAALAKVFTAAPADTAALALKFAAPELRRRVMRAVSPGRARALGDSPGRTGFDAVEAAQKRVLDVALQLQAAGRILIDPRDPDLAGK